MACRVTICCCAPLGMVVQVECGPRRGRKLVGSFNLLSHQGVLAAIVGIGVITVGTGRRLGMLLRMTRRCSRGVVRNVSFAVGLRISKMGGASVIQGIVIMGE
jgi:hypothetical protein